MSNLVTVAQWHDTINKVDVTEPIVGGDGGNANLATRQLAENILWLKQQMANQINEAYAVGDIYMTTIKYPDAAAVAAHHGYGTWKRYAEGRVLVGFSTNDSDPDEYKTMGNTFGENEHKLTIEEMPIHKHSKGDIYNKFLAKASDVLALPLNSGYIGNGSGLTPSGFDNNNNGNEHQSGQMSAKSWSESTEASVGGDQPHNNIQPSIVAAYWLRTA